MADEAKKETVKQEPKAKKETVKLIYLGKKSPKVVMFNGDKVKFAPDAITEVPSALAAVLLEKAGNIFIVPGGTPTPAINYESDNSIAERINEAARRRKLREMLKDKGGE